MKKALLSLVILVATLSSWAQGPQKLSYQAVVRNADNQLIVNKTIGLKITILRDQYDGLPVYSEVFRPMANENGLISVEIGGNNGFWDIDWSKGPYFLRTEIDPAGNTAYSISGTTQLLSVPFALFSNESHRAQFAANEFDPVFTNSPAYGIGFPLMDKWNTAFNWGNHADAGYLKSFTESDPLFSAWDKSSGISIGTSQITDFGNYEPAFEKASAFNRNFGTTEGTVTEGNDERVLKGLSAFEWGNHADAGYLKTFTETDPVFDTTPARNITEADIQKWNDKNFISLTNAPDIANTTENKNITLSSSGSDASFRIDNGNGNTVFKVDGTGRITGDGSGLSNIKPLIQNTGGNFDHEIVSFNAYDPDLIKSVTLTTNGPGVVLVQATGYAQFHSQNQDYFRMSVLESTVQRNTATFGTQYFGYLMLCGDFGCADTVDQYSSFAYSRVLTVAGSGTYTYNLYADKGYSYCKTKLADVNMQAIFIPTGGTGASAPMASAENQGIPENPVVSGSLDGQSATRRDSTSRSKAIESEQRINQLEEKIDRLEKIILDLNRKRD